MKKCVFCGAELDDNAKACSNCGRILPKEDWPKAEEKTENSAAQAAGSSDQDTGWNNGNPQGQNSGWNNGTAQDQNIGWNSGNAQSQNGGWNNGTAQDQNTGWNNQNNWGNGYGWNGQNSQNSQNAGAPYGQQGYGGVPQNGQKTNVFAIVSLVQGILSAFLNLILFFIPSVLAIVFGILGIMQIRQDPNQKGKGMAITGLILGAIFLALTVLLFVFSIYLMNHNPEFSQMVQEMIREIEGGSGLS